MATGSSTTLPGPWFPDLFRRSTYGATARHLDSKGAVATASGVVDVRTRPLAMLSGVLIRLNGSVIGGFTRVARLTVKAPRGATVKVKCKGNGCPKRAVKRGKGRVIRFKALERRLAAGIKLTVVSKAGFLSRHTTLSACAGPRAEARGPLPRARRQAGDRLSAVGGPCGPGRGYHAPPGQDLHARAMTARRGSGTAVVSPSSQAARRRTGRSTRRPPPSGWRARPAERGSELYEDILRLQGELFIAGAELATAPEAAGRLEGGVSRVTDDMVERLGERHRPLHGRVDCPPEFVIPGGTELSARLDVARAVVRRAERARGGAPARSRLTGDTVWPT